ncbi:unnamed protein product [Prorocentrum cordatum]|uniref:Chitin-binding type-4 domain-containing protein n=1 Tax=Prorocentrum cordatum TaxID=2364126 RepID=A0ABN9R1Y4_9DINO|nr:unnamed protein product [Polarella glacialis]
MAPAPLAAALLLGSLLSLANGHAYITQPAMRGGAFNQPLNGYCPQCLGSSSLPLPTCGQRKFLDVASPVTELRAGELAEFAIRMTAHHKGHFVFRLCDRHLDGTSGGFQAEEACLNEHVLKRARPEEVHSDCVPNDSRGDCQPYDEANPGYWYLPPPGQSEYRFHYWIPSNLTCQSCTLQWWWMSANSCTPHDDAYACYFREMARSGWNAAAWWGGASASANCPAVQAPPRECGEQFKNCADVRVVDGSGTFAPTPPPAPTLPPTPAPTLAPGAGCVHQTDCSRSDWCNDPKFTTWCPGHPASNCPSPHCTVSGGRPGQAPTAAPTARPTAPPTQAPSTTSAPRPTPPSPATSSITPTTTGSTQPPTLSSSTAGPTTTSTSGAQTTAAPPAPPPTASPMPSPAPSSTPAPSPLPSPAPSPAPPVSTVCTECAATHPGAACVWPTGQCYRVLEDICAHFQGTWCGGASLAESGLTKTKRHRAFLGVALLQAPALELRQHEEL